MFTVCTTPPPVKKLGAVQRLKPAKSNIYARLVAGLFFCLASAEGAGLLFCPVTIQPHTIVYSAFCIVNANYTDRAAKQHTGLYRRFSRNLYRSAAADTRPTQAVIMPPAPCWGASHRSSVSSVYPIPTPRRTLYRSAHTAYYNKVYKGAAVRPCYGSMPDGAAYRRPCQPGGAVQQQERGGRRGTIDGYRRISFRAFAR